MLTYRGAFYTLVAGACAAGSLERSPQSRELDESSDQPPAVVLAQSASLHQNGGRDEEQRNESLDFTENRSSRTQDDGLEARQATPNRPPTVFSTRYITSTITTYVGEPFTSTILATVTSIVTLTDPANGRKTETLTVTSSPAQQKRTILRTPNAERMHPSSAVPIMHDPPMRSDQEKRQNTPTTVTSTILMIVRTVITAAPTVSVTSTATLSSTLTTSLPISTTTFQVVTIFTGSDGSTSTLFPSTTSLSGTSSQSSQPLLPTGTPVPSSIDQGATAGIVIGGIVGTALLLGFFFCLVRRKRKRKESSRSPNPGNPTTIARSSSPDRDQGTLIHHETFHVGASPPPSVAPPPSASERQLPLMKHESAAAAPASLEMKQAVPAGAIRSVPWTGSTTALDTRRRNTDRSGGVFYVHSDDGNSNGSGFGSTEAQPPSPVASSDIFGPYNNTYRPGRDTWASSVGMGAFSTPRNLSIVDDGDGFGRGSMGSLWRDEEQDRRDLWTPTVPEQSRSTSRSKELDRTVRFEEDSVAFGGTSGNGRGSADGSSAFL